MVWEWHVAKWVLSGDFEPSDGQIDVSETSWNASGVSGTLRSDMPPSYGYLPYNDPPFGRLCR